MTAVVDASVAARWYFEEAGSETADRILADSAAGERSLIAPDLIVPELLGVLWRKTQVGECPRDSAEAILDLWDEDCPDLVPSGWLADRAFDLAMTLDHPVYDCLYLALAIEYEAKLVTADRGLARVARTFLSEVELVA